MSRIFDVARRSSFNSGIGALSPLAASLAFEPIVDHPTYGNCEVRSTIAALIYELPNDQCLP